MYPLRGLALLVWWTNQAAALKCFNPSNFLCRCFLFLRQSARTGASELVQSVSSISNFLPLTNNSPKRFTLCGRNNSPQTSMLKMPLEKSIHPFFRPFVHASHLAQAFSTSNIHPSIRPLVFPSLHCCPSLCPSGHR